ncbi:MAG: TMEM175 family protein [Solirubrobacteraceae bacterium]
MAEAETFNDNESAPERAFDYDRTVALSDGVFAIALTLLVLSLSVPSLRAGHTSVLGKRLLHQHDEFVAYAISFAVIALLWVRHHLTFRTLSRIDGRVTGLNLAYLALVAFLPFPTRVLAVYGEEPSAVALYAATGAALSLLAGLIRFHILRAGLVHPSRAHELEDREHWLFPPAVFIASIPIAYVNPTAAKFFWLLLAAQNASARVFRKRSSSPDA